MFPHDGHLGPGGWRTVPQSSQRWTRSSPAAVPAQKNSVSGETTGRMTWRSETPGGAEGVASPWGGLRGSGLNLSTRKSMVATGSPAEVQVLRVVTNHPSPSAVRLGPVTSSSLDWTASCSPTRTGRW